jgi:hypothetical protein
MTTRNASWSNGTPLGITAGGSRDRHEAYAASICRFRKKIDPFESGEEFEANAFYFILFHFYLGRSNVSLQSWVHSEAGPGRRHGNGKPPTRSRFMKPPARVAMMNV